MSFSSKEAYFVLGPVNGAGKIPELRSLAKIFLVFSFIEKCEFLYF
jgi:hypothetical protein